MNATAFFVNATTNNSLTEPRPSEELSTFAAVLTILIIIVGVSGNILTIIALIKCPRIRNAAAAFIVSLCMADLLFCVIVMPFSVHRFLFGLSELGKQESLCVLLPFMQYANVGVSLLSVALITVNRYIMIAHQSVYKKIYTKTTIGVMIAVSWIFSYSLLVPTAMGKWGKFDYDNLLGSCSIVEDSKGKSPKSALFILAFLIPCLAIVVCYARIFWVVRSSEARLRKHRNREAGGADDGVPSSGGSFRTGSEWRVTKMVLAIFLSFVVCYLPITLIKVVDKQVKSPDAHTMSYVLIYLSACINPIIYVIMNRQYRQAYKSVICCSRFDQGAFHSGPDKSHNTTQGRTVVSNISLAPVGTHHAVSTNPVPK